MVEKLDYNYKTDFEIWKENKEFERQNNERSQPSLELAPFGKKQQTPKH